MFEGGAKMKGCVDREKILAELRKYKPVLGRRYGIVKLGVFGSVARGDMKSSSDVDVVVEVKDVDPFALLDIKKELSRLLGRKVDLIRLRKNMNRALKRRIEREAIYV